MAKMIPDEQLRELIALGEKATPTPWTWNVNLKSKHIYLESHGRGHRFEYIMDFSRWGMNGATPRFRSESDIMENAELWAVTVEGREHHAEWHRTLQHPDARYLAASANLAVPLADEVLRLRAENALLREERRALVAQLGRMCGNA